MTQRIRPMSTKASKNVKVKRDDGTVKASTTVKRKMRLNTVVKQPGK